MRKVNGGAWFPVRIESRSWDTESGKRKLTFERVYELNVEQSTFNRPSEIPDSVFEIPIDSKEVLDYRDTGLTPSP